jgi:hypothetical protein
LATPAATMLVDEPMSESVPPSIVAKERGMSICVRVRVRVRVRVGVGVGVRVRVRVGVRACVAGMPSELAHEATIGMNIAQTGWLGLGLVC